MTVTILASILICLVLLIALAGFRAAFKQQSHASASNSEQCSLCRQKFHKSLLIERQVGDYKLLFFCPTCIGNLHDEMVRKN